MVFGRHKDGKFLPGSLTLMFLVRTSIATASRFFNTSGANKKKIPGGKLLPSSTFA
jgi:hypothetical protein